MWKSTYIVYVWIFVVVVGRTLYRHQDKMGSGRKKREKPVCITYSRGSRSQLRSVFVFSGTVFGRWFEVGFYINIVFFSSPYQRPRDHNHILWSHEKCESIDTQKQMKWERQRERKKRTNQPTKCRKTNHPKYIFRLFWFWAGIVKMKNHMSCTL